jgi:hypothetical protein
MTDDPTVYVAEAYTDGERVDQIVHTTYAGAKEDIEVSAYDADEYDITEKRLYGGKEGKAVITHE